jgi:zinc transport system ATP-binding protein
MPTEIVSVDNVSFGYGSSLSLENISFKVNEGDFLGIVGPNGAGKTTLFRCMLRVLDGYKGTISLFGQDIRHNKNLLKRIGYIPQKRAIEQGFPVTVEEVVSFGLVGRQFSKSKVSSAIEDVGLAGYRDRRIDELSGGQLQRVLIAKSLVSNPDLLILDEPTIAVDIESENKFYSILTDLNKKRKMTIVWSSHDLDAIKKLADKVACINKKLFFHGNVLEFFGNEKLMMSAYLESSMQAHMHSHFDVNNTTINDKKNVDSHGI